MEVGEIPEAARNQDGLPVAGHAVALRRVADDVELLAVYPNGFRRNNGSSGEHRVCRIAEQGRRKTEVRQCGRRHGRCGGCLLLKQSSSLRATQRF